MTQALARRGSATRTGSRLIRILPCICAAMLLQAGLSGGAIAQTRETADVPKVTRPDNEAIGTTAYVSKAQIGDLMEIELGRIAVQRSQNEKLRNFARKMVDAHSVMLSDFAGAVQAAGLSVIRPKLEAEDMRKIDELRALPDGEFDKAYITTQISMHKEALDLHQGYARGGESTVLKKAAEKAVPLVREHLQMAEGLAH